MNLDLLRSRHMLLRMFLGCVLSPPSLPLSFPANGPSNGSKTGQNSRSGRGAAAPKLGRARQQVGRTKVGAAAPKWQPPRPGVGAAAPELGRPRQRGGRAKVAALTSNLYASVSFSSSIRLLHRFFSMKDMILLFVLLSSNLHNTTLKHIKNIKSLRTSIKKLVRTKSRKRTWSQVV